MESRKIIILAIIVGLLGMFFSYYYLSRKERALLQGMQLKTVLVAARDIPPKTKLTRNLFRQESIPERYISPKALTINKPSDLNKIIDKINLVPISAGQQIITSEIVPPSEETGISVNVPPNLRGIIVQIDNIDIIDLIKPNDKVDVVTIFSAQHATKGKVKVASTILQDVFVIAVSENLGVPEEDADSFKKRKSIVNDNSKTLAMMTVTLALAPEQVQILALAKNQGDIVLSIRSNNDNDIKTNLAPIDSTIFLS